MPKPVTQWKHTPGPWTAVIKEVRGNGRCIASTANNATREGLELGLEAKIVFDRENIANARLLAAAPELLALVRAYLNTYPLDEYSDRAEKLITRAEGSV